MGSNSFNTSEVKKCRLDAASSWEEENDRSGAALDLEVSV